MSKNSFMLALLFVGLALEVCCGICFVFIPFNISFCYIYLY